MWSRLSALAVAAAAAVLAVAAAAAQSPGSTPTPTPGLPCPGMMNVIDGPVDPTLAVELTATAGPSASEVTLYWTMSGASNCAWIQRKHPGSNPPYFAMADWVFGPGPGTLTTGSFGDPGEHCYRLFAVSDVGQSLPSEACIEVLQPATPRPPEVAATPPSGAPTDVPVCPNYLDLDRWPVDPSLAPTLEARWDNALKGIEVTWSAERPGNCAFFQTGRSPGVYSGFESIAWADWVLAPGEGVRLFRGAAPDGETRCYRLFALSFAGRSEPVEACADVPAGAVPTPPSPGSYPTPSGTPWPAPVSLRLEGETILLDEASFPLGPSRQAWFAGISWSVLPGFTGLYEVQRAQLSSGPAALNWESLRSGQFPASGAAGGRIGFAEQVTPLTTWCFRVRTIVNSPTGLEPGPFSNEVCQQLPPHSGGFGPGAAPTPAPLPPDAGNTPLTAGETGWLAAAGGAALAVVGTMVLALRGRRG